LIHSFQIFTINIKWNYWNSKIFNYLVEQKNTHTHKRHNTESKKKTNNSSHRLQVFMKGKDEDKKRYTHNTESKKQQQQTRTPGVHEGWGVPVSYFFIFRLLFFVFFLLSVLCLLCVCVFFCLRPVACVPNVVSVSGLSVVNYGSFWFTVFKFLRLT
jgi:Flp pilus assembly protein TadB